MSSRCSLLYVVGLVCSLSCALAPIELHAQERDRGPQGNQQITQLANGLAATTRAGVDKGGLRVNTDVPIPVPGVFETRSDIVGTNHGTLAVSIPGAITQWHGPSIAVPSFSITNFRPLDSS
jgi:hypothetical protein